MSSRKPPDPGPVFVYRWWSMIWGGAAWEEYRIASSMLSVGDLQREQADLPSGVRDHATYELVPCLPAKEVRRRLARIKRDIRALEYEAARVKLAGKVSNA